MKSITEAEDRLNLRAAIAAGQTRSGTVYDQATGEPVVSYWPTTDGRIDARWHRREKHPAANGDILDDADDCRCYQSSHYASDLR